MFILTTSSRKYALILSDKSIKHSKSDATARFLLIF